MDDKSLIDQLRERVRHHEAEAARYRQAVQALEGTHESIMPKPKQSKQRPTDDPRKSTVKMLDRVLKEATGELTISELTYAMKANGWVTLSKDPSNTVRTSVGRKVADGTVIKSADGGYRLARATEYLINAASDNA